MHKSKKVILCVVLFVVIAVAISAAVIASNISSCNHAFSDYKSNGNATYFSDGTKTAKCDNGCGKKNTVTDTGSKLSFSKAVNLVAEQSADTVTLNWGEAEGASGYSVYCKTGDNWEELTSSTKKTTYTVKNLQSGTKYNFAVKAYKKASGQVVYTEEPATVYTSTKCDVIDEVTATAGSSAVKLTWDEVNGADGYRVYRKTDDVWQVEGEYVTETSFIVKGLTPLNSYNFAVCPYVKTDAIVLSDLTECEAYTVTEAPETKAEFLSKNEISITFSSVDGAEGYQVYSKINSGKAELYKTFDEGSTFSVSLEPDNYYTFAVRGYVTFKGETLYGEYNPVTVHCGTVEDRIVIDPYEGEWYLVLVNKARELPPNYTVELDYIADGYCIDARAAVYYNKMYEDAASEGIYLTPVSAYRSIELQEETFEEFVVNYINSEGLTREEAEKKTAEEVLSPGTSEHNLGLAVDVGCDEGYFEDSAGYAWLVENAHKYGFIERYTVDKESITGIIPEAWHWRFVGVEHATKIRQSGLCLEEYLAQNNLIP